MISPKGGPVPTRLVRVNELPAIVAAHPKAKISITYAAMRGGQSHDHVAEEWSVCIDMDGIATRADVERLQRRFPGAAAIFANGVSLLYRIPPGMAWEDAVRLCLQIGAEAETITQLHHDRQTVVGRQRNHLFRYPGAWAHKREARVEWFEPLDSNRGLVEDAAGLAHVIPTGASKKPIKGVSTKKTGGKKRAESVDTSNSSALLKARLAALRAGKTVAEAAAIAAASVGVPLAEAEALFNRPGYEPKPVIGREFTAADDADVGMVGLVSSSRVRQRHFSWWANFAHSLQSFWDVGRGAPVAFLGVTHFPELAIFVERFKAEFGKDWKKALWQDISRCYERFGERKGLRPVSKHCFDEVRAALAQGPASAVELAKRSGFSDRQIKRAVKELAKKGEVTATGKKRWQKWALTQQAPQILSGHTEELKGKKVEMGCLGERHALPGCGPLPRKRVRRPAGCPQNTRRTRQQFNAERKAAATARKTAAAAAKDQKTCQEIRSLRLPAAVEAAWVSRPADFRLLKGNWAYRTKEYYSTPREKRRGDEPAPLAATLIKEWRYPCIVRALKKKAAKRAARRASALEIEVRRETVKREREAERAAALADAAV